MAVKRGGEAFPLCRLKVIEPTTDTLPYFKVVGRGVVHGKSLDLKVDPISEEVTPVRILAAEQSSAH